MACVKITEFLVRLRKTSKTRERLLVCEGTAYEKGRLSGGRTDFKTNECLIVLSTLSNTRFYRASTISGETGFGTAMHQCAYRADTVCVDRNGVTECMMPAASYGTICFRSSGVNARTSSRVFPKMPLLPPIPYAGIGVPDRVLRM